MEEIARVESDFTTGHDEFIPNLPNFCARCERQSDIDFFLFSKSTVFYFSWLQLDLK